MSAAPELHDDRQPETLAHDHLEWAIQASGWLARKSTLPVSVDREDLAQEALTGFLQACRSYDPGYGSGFRTFAFPRMRGAMLDYVRSLDHLSRHEREAVTSALDGINDLPVSVEIKMNRKKHVVAVNSNNVREELEPLLDIDGEDSHFTRPQTGVEERGYAQTIAGIDASAALGRIESDRYRLILELRYKAGFSQKQIAATLGVTESRVSQLEAAALNAAHHVLTEPQASTNPRSSVRCAGELSPRELEILRLVATGRTDPSIAAVLGVSTATVRTHMKKILSKTLSRNRTHAVANGYRRKLIDLGAGNDRNVRSNAPDGVAADRRVS